MSELETLRIRYPLDISFLQRHQKKLRRRLKEGMTQPSLKVAVLGGSTTNEVAQFIELFLLEAGINVEMYQSDYNQFYEEAVFESPTLDEFKPQVVYLHTSHVNIHQWPDISAGQAEVDQVVNGCFEHFHTVWQALVQKYNATIIQNNFELPFARPLGNLDGSAVCGKTMFTHQLNACFAQYAQQNEGFILHDLNYLSSWFGLEKWYDRESWYAYKYAMHRDAFPALGHSIAAQIKATLGMSKKTIVCDLDNTLWGGIIGDDGLNGIQIGKEHPNAQAFTDLQSYLKALHQRGVLLAVCSKNEIDNAKLGFTHPDTVLTAEDFSAFEANWDNKDANIANIAKTLNIGLDALAFIDDNPSERGLVAQAHPMVAVPDIGSNIVDYIGYLDKAGLFELVSLNKEDLKRTDMYLQNQQRQALESQYQDYGDYLQSLDMKASIEPLGNLSLSRVTQLINKTNQFNLTTYRYAAQEVESFMLSENYLTLCGRLTDKFGDNGIVSAIIGEKKGTELHLNLWIMSCRVFKRDMEWAMFSELRVHALSMGITQIFGHFIPTKKNGLVKEHYKKLGFECLSESEDGSAEWAYELKDEPLDRAIPINIEQ